jgi:glycosyltransferase involved in cell wall biosynthesis
LISDHKISVVIPSLADASRAKFLDRSIESVLGQTGVCALPIVVVNGGRHDPLVLESLMRRTDIRCVHFSHGGLPEARLKGRDSVDAPFFANLDDDDVLLPDSLATRLRPMLLDEQLDVVISNGYRESPDGRRITDPNIDRFQSDPLDGLMEVCWLNESGGLFRTQSIGREFFMNLPSVVEWTYIAFQLAQSRKILFLDIPTFIKHDTPDSLSKSIRYEMQHPYVLRDMLRWQMPPAIRAKLKRKYIAALHQTSVTLLERGDFPTAWRYHFESLLRIGGQQYLPFTRHILQQQLAGLAKQKSG